ncbi:MAG TPA: AMP-binding protein [Accumulibacter sp.]|uniref:AMP-binding protein n=2 Tax=Candidatus Accumulibacter TaxID=327159 RepID=A0A080M929_9PROT|nr:MULTISPECIES: AMP-binding protein [Candidatus Accumulibacter]KFB76975.1 MAG: Acetyl-coenzyme A synthetase [Candidatus Accumulibacter cognatus]MBL8399696.1 AMP-binding protein [Accumulibacter sp.]MBO3711879.1 AMP-binding protein [Accumulibacter sp.]MCC2869994.1 AMP-binding protein [Candidatus Accumulibacter phosphatis]MCM8579660.1 AMP-binding protein [Accumulibacter sp.]
MVRNRWHYTGQLPPTRFNMARYCLAAAARDTPDKVALVVVSDAKALPERAECWTYRQLDETVRQVAAGLRAWGLDPGARLMIRMGNTSDYALLFFGAIAAGCVPLPSSAQLTEEEADFLLADAGAEMVAMSEELAIHPPPDVRVLTPADIARLRTHHDAVDYADTAAADPAFLIYTSGTTGQPKGVLHAQRSAWGRRPMYQGWYDIRQDDVVLHTGAFNWTYTLGVGLTDPWANGATAVLYNGPRDITVWPMLMEKFQATLFAAVPGLYRQILKYNDLRAFDLSSLRHGLTAGEALGSALLEQWRTTTGKELYEALGMSECSTYISSSPSVGVRPGSSGKPQQGRCVVVLPVEEGEEPLSPGETGLLAVHRSDPGLMLGYWKRPDEEELVYRGEWFIGGDLVHFDADGYLIYHGRNDDMMNAMGYRVSPLEVEHCLSKHPAVAEVAVTELRVREGVSVIAAFVVPRDPDEPDGLDAAPLLAYAHEHLAAYKCPREVIFTDGLPRTANGKVRRRDLAWWRR